MKIIHRAPLSAAVCGNGAASSDDDEEEEEEQEQEVCRAKLPMYIYNTMYYYAS